MSLFSLFTRNGDRRDLERALLDASFTQQEHTSLWTGTFNASITVYGPMVRYAGRWFDAVFCVARASSTPVIVFQPQVIIAGTAYAVGKSRTPSPLEFGAGLAVRLHDERSLRKAIPEEAILAVKATATSGSLTDPVFSFVTIGG